MAALTTTRVPSLDYTSRDQLAIFNDMVAAIPFYCPEWTDRNDTDQGIALARMFAGAMDVLHFYIDRAAGEMFLPTAVKRESVVKILRLIGFELRSITPASADCTFTITVLLVDLLIPKGTKVQTVASAVQSPVVYETATDLTIPAGQTQGIVSVVEGESSTEALGTSSGQAFQHVPLTSSIIITSSLVFQVDEGAGFISWTLVTSFVNSGPGDLHYVVELDADENVTIILGDNLQGKVPTAGAVMRANLRSIQGDRGGVFGNVGAGAISIVVDKPFSGGSPVSTSVTNPAQASGGADVQSIDDAKRLGPASLRALNRAVTAEDYKTLAEQFGGVAKAIAVQGTGRDPCCACNLNIYVAPVGGGTLSTTAKQDLLDFLDGLKMVGTCIAIQDPNYVPTTIQGVATVFSNVDLNGTKDTINSALDAFFDLAGDNADFGRNLFLGNLFSSIEGVTGVDHVDIVQCSRVPKPLKEIWSGNGTIGAVTVGSASQDENWVMTFLSPTTFSVVGSESGIQANGTVGVAYVSNKSEIAFTITAGVSPQALGDRVTFKTSTFLGNIPIDSTEIMAKGSISLSFVVVPARLTNANC